MIRYLCVVHSHTTPGLACMTNRIRQRWWYMTWHQAIEDTVASALISNLDHSLGESQLQCCKDTQVASGEAHTERNGGFQPTARWVSKPQSSFDVTVARTNCLTTIWETLIQNNPAKPCLHFWPPEIALDKRCFKLTNFGGNFFIAIVNHTKTQTIVSTLRVQGHFWPTYMVLFCERGTNNGFKNSINCQYLQLGDFLKILFCYFKKIKNKKIL